RSGRRTCRSRVGIEVGGGAANNLRLRCLAYVGRRRLDAQRVGASADSHHDGFIAILRTEYHVASLFGECPTLGVEGGKASAIGRIRLEVSGRGKCGIGGNPTRGGGALHLIPATVARGVVLDR